MTTQKVFISHSHENRDVAVQLENILKKHEAETFLDQDRIEVGDVLPSRLEDGIKWCNKFLLLWSVSAARSAWVEREWNIAYDLSKKIIPYRLDTYPLPDELQDRVYIDIEDKNRAHGDLLTAVFGRDFKPTDPTVLFPGQWKMAVMFDPGRPNAKVEFDLRLRGNGQVEGPGRLNQAMADGMLQDGLGQMGPARYFDPDAMFAAQIVTSQLGPVFKNIRFSASGSWSYEETIGELSIDCVIKSSLGSSGRFTLRLAVEDEPIAGELSGACTFIGVDWRGQMSGSVTLRRTN